MRRLIALLALAALGAACRHAVKLSVPAPPGQKASQAQMGAILSAQQQ